MPARERTLSHNPVISPGSPPGEPRVWPGSGMSPDGICPGLLLHGAGLAENLSHKPAINRPSVIQNRGQTHSGGLDPVGIYIM